MRAIELAKVAAAAETLRLKRLAHRQILRAAVAAAGAVFALGAFAMLHVLCFIALCAVVAPWLAAAILLAFDLVVAGLLVTTALSSKPDRIEREALMVRHESIAGAKRAFNVLAIAGELTGLALTRRVRQSVARPGLGRYLVLADIVSRVVRRR